MSVYYNEIDPYAAQWLRNLISENLIAPGEVDERSITDVQPGDLQGFIQCHFFAGIGGWPLALQLAGWPADRPVWTGSCPCQPFSLAGAQRGFDDTRHLWPVWRELIRERRPAKVYGEQVASATEWLGLVRSDLEEMGYAMGAMPLQAASAGADHLRDRFYFVANANDTRSQGWELLPERTDQWLAGSHGVADTDSMCREVDTHSRGRSEGSAPRQVAGPIGASDGDMAIADIISSGEEWEQRGRQQCGLSGDSQAFDWVIGADGKARRVKPGIRLLANGVPARVGKLRAFGNAIYPPIAAAFIKATS